MNAPDPGLLSDLFSRHLGRAVTVTSVERGPVGNGQEVWFVGLDDGEGYVLRRTAPGGPLQWTDRDAEFQTLAAVGASGLPVPRGLWHEPEGGALGGAYFVMTRMEGAPGARAGGDESQEIAADLGRLLARLHGAGLETDPGSAAGGTRAELDSWSRRYAAERATQLPLIDVLLAHLEEGIPGDDEPAVRLWGDAGPHNALHDGGTVTALLDWELSHAGDRHEDLGSLAWYYAGRGEFQTALAAYEAEAGLTLDRDRIRYFEVMACVTRSIMLVNAGAHYVNGETAAPNLAGLHLHLVPASLLRAGRLLGWDEPAVDPPEVDTEATALRPDAADLLAGTIRFLRDQVLPASSDPSVRRGLRTTEALLATAALRMAGDPATDRRRDEERVGLLEAIGRAGISTDGGFAKSAVRVERSGDDELKATVRTQLMREAAIMRDLAGPLNELYGG